MSKLYTELADIYEAMYATFIDYKDEYNFYSNLLRKYDKKSVLEIGSGTGNLSKLFHENGFEYLGMDLSTDMLDIAKRKFPTCAFVKGDMRNFQLDKPLASALVTGRSVSYLLTNEDVKLAFKSIHKNLKENGIFCFDFIDANRFIPEILKAEKIIHRANYKGVEYCRESKWHLNLAHGMDFRWDSVYSKLSGDQQVEIATHSEIARTFTKDEILLFLEINGFETLEIIDKPAYAFQTFVIVAKKKT